MSKANEVPQAALNFGFLLIITSIIVAAYSSITGEGRTEIPVSETVEHLDLFFQDRDDGSVDVVSAVEGDVLETLQIDEGGFVRVVMRGMVRERKSRNIGSEVPFRLIKRADGRLMMTDPVLNSQIDLEPFGSNKNSFGRWLDAAPKEYTTESKFSLQQS